MKLGPLPKFIGMVHLRALPGSPRFAGSWNEVVDAAVRDAQVLKQGGVDGIMMENFGDTPFFSGSVPPHVISMMTAIAAEIRREFRGPLGINVLRNDGIAALSVAAAVGAQFIRVNILTGARLTDQGIISGNAHEILRLRSTLCTSVRIMADVDVKHSAPIAPFSFENEVEDMIERGMADAVIVSGSGTGKEPKRSDLELVRKISEHPLFVGSGVHLSNVAEILKLADGIIVGTALKKTSDIHSPVDAEKVAKFRSKIDQA